MENQLSNGGYWPGFVGALTNVLSALVFVVVILTALAGMLGQMIAGFKANQIVKNTKVVSSAGRLGPVNEKKAGDMDRAEGSAETAPSGTVSSSTSTGLSQEKNAALVSTEKNAAKAARRLIEIEFEGSVIDLGTAAIKQLDANLSIVRTSLPSASARLIVYTSGFSETQRLGFLRAVAMRNYLLDRGMKPSNISIAVIEGKDSSDAQNNGKTVVLEVQ